MNDKIKSIVDVAMSEYENALFAIARYKEREGLDDAAAELCRRINLNWLSDVMSTSSAFEEKSVSELPDETVAKYDNREDGLPLVGVIFYRGIEMPCYDDGYGQQIVATFKGRDWGSGAYNLCYADEFCRRADCAIDEEMWSKLVEEASKRAAQ